MVRSLPLRNGFFATPQITPSEEAELLSWGRALVPELFHADAEWTIVHEKKGIHVSEDRQKGGLTYSIRSVSTVKATLDDVMDMFVTTSTLEFRALMNMLHRDHFADAAVLYHKEQNESENLGIKWLALRGKKSSINPIVQLQDYCVLEYTGVVGQDIIGGDPQRPLGVCLFESIEQMECPQLYDSHHLERGSISKCGYLFRPRVDDGIVEAHFVCSIRQPPNQRSKRRLNRALLLNWAEAVGRIEESMQRKRISKELTMRRSPNWVHDADRHCCHLCMKTFSSTRRKHHCRACGEIICRNCSLYKSVDLATVGVTTLRVCKACMDGTNATTTTTTNANSSTNSSTTSTDAANLPLPPGVDDERLRDAVEQYALALPGQQVSTVPDLVGLAWLRQVAQRDPTKKDMVTQLMERIREEEQQRNAAAAAEADKSNQVDIYDTLCDLAAQTLACKFAVVSLIDENRQWFKSAVNVQEADVPRDFSFCEYPVRDRRPLVVMDATRDPRFVNNPFVSGPLGVRFLAGAPLFTVDNECVGAVCVMDTEPRFSLQESQIATMQNLAHLAMVMVKERRDAQAKFAKAANSSQLVPAPQRHQIAAHPQHYGGSEYGAPGTSSDLVPLAYNESAIVAQPPKPRGNEDPMLKEQMIQLLQKASQVRDQVSINAQHAGLNSSAE